ncbi:bifunctional riboflavin kinase/FAD synthetase [Desertibacillus haloalkaliphilus]|uniref:bifunctional riboflavin kinase/FAD synthetase n=1 Tax=Desertibacillus haloalkaliphilus TaxID=1328930 RepID=UPI001C278DF9|nr:bifunctional riboflavin kinase/FAD synthetase [Desertibacillus haloalkaliphilus]MBU8906967.1 bifunctional riboflavin kinase/FAD synthetase [Desertibacillus haloalkaliphilus]
METVYISHPHQIKKDDLKPTVMALGFFDGVHLGHQQVITTAKTIAKNKGYNCSVMTFNPHPKEVLRAKRGSEQMPYLTPIKDKARQIEQLDVDRLYIVQFSKEFASLTPQQFVDEYLIRLHVKHVVAGFDYTYGNLGKGTMETLPFHSRNEFEQTTVHKVEESERKISSTLIRELIKNGEVADVPAYLGRYYQISGTVIHGDKRGRTIGFPTANIEFTDRYLSPSTGVYAVSMQVDGKSYEGVCNVGYKPTFYEDSQQATIEVHLFDFERSIYGAEVTLQWLTYIRGERKFNSVDELTKQISKDKEEAIAFFHQQKVKE